MFLGAPWIPTLLRPLLVTRTSVFIGFGLVTYSACWYPTDVLLKNFLRNRKRDLDWFSTVGEVLVGIEDVDIQTSLRRFPHIAILLDKASKGEFHYLMHVCPAHSWCR